MLFGFPCSYTHYHIPKRIEVFLDHIKLNFNADTILATLTIQFFMYSKEKSAIFFFFLHVKAVV